MPQMVWATYHRVVRNRMLTQLPWQVCTDGSHLCGIRKLIISLLRSGDVLHTRVSLSKIRVYKYMYKLTTYPVILYSYTCACITLIYDVMH